MDLADTPEPPYIAVIFTSTRTDDDAGYEATDAAMTALAATQPGYLGVEAVSDGRTGITVSYWATDGDARAWKAVAEHSAAQQSGRQRWYQTYAVRVATVERAYGFEGTEPGSG